MELLTVSKVYISYMYWDMDCMLGAQAITHQVKPGYYEAKTMEGGKVGWYDKAKKRGFLEVLPKTLPNLHYR